MSLSQNRAAGHCLGVVVEWVLRGRVSTGPPPREAQGSAPSTSDGANSRKDGGMLLLFFKVPCVYFIFLLGYNTYTTLLVSGVQQSE